MPGPPGAEAVVDDEVVKYTGATVARYYRANVTEDEVRALYDREMRERGWRLVHEKRITGWGQDDGGFMLVFARDDDTAFVTYAGAARPYEWDVAVEFQVRE